MSDCQPQLLFLMPDLKLTGSVNVQSVTSQAGACTPTVVADVSTCGTLVPMLSGVPEDTSADPLDLQVQKAGEPDEGATFVWKETGATDYFGMDDARKLIRADAPFRGGAFPDMQQGEAAAYVRAHKRLIVTTVDPVAGEFLFRYRDVDADVYDDWTNLSVSPPSRAPAITDGVSFQRVQLLALESGPLLLAYRYVRIPQASLNIWDVAILRSDDGGLTWVFVAANFLRDRIISDDGHQFRLTESGAWIRLDVVLETGKDLLSVASRTCGSSWTDPVESDLSPIQGSVANVDPSPFCVAGIGGGRFLLGYTTAADEWSTAQAFAGFAWSQVGGDPALLTRTENGTIRGMGATVAHERVYVLISYDDGPGSTTDDQMALYFQTLGQVFAAGPGTLGALIVPPNEWQPVLPFTRYRGARNLPVRITLLYMDREILLYGGLVDVVSVATQNATVVVQLSHTTVASFGNVSPGGAITTTQFTLLEPLYDVLWQSFTGRPAGGGAQSSPDTEWTETVAGAPTIAWNERRLSLISGVGDSVYYEITVTSSATSSWVIGGSTVGAIATIVSGSTQAAASHGVRITSQLSRVGQEVRAILRMDTTGITVFDAGIPGTAGSIVVDLTVKTEIRFRIEEGTANNNPFGLWAAKLTDYFNPVALNGTLNDSATGPADTVRFGVLATGTAGESEWREVWVSEFVTRGTSATFANPADLLGAPVTSGRFRLGNCLWVAWGGGASLPTDRWITRPCFVHGAQNIFADASHIGWRSVDLTSQTLILRPEDGTGTGRRFVHSGIALFGLEDRTVVVDYDSDPGFGSPTPGGTVDTTLFGDLEVVGGSINGPVLRYQTGTPPKREPIDGELGQMRVRFTGGGAAGRTYCVTEHCGDVLTLGRVVDGEMVPADLAGDGVAGGDPFVAFAPFGFVRYGVERIARYMRLRFTDTDTCTSDHRLGALVPGCEVVPPFHLQWRHTDDEQSAVEVVEGPSTSHANTRGRPRRIWSGRLVGDADSRFRESFRYLLRVLAGYQQRPLVLIPNEDNIRSMIRGRFTPAPLENAGWWDQDDGDGPYTRPFGDLAIQVVEVP